MTTHVMHAAGFSLFRGKENPSLVVVVFLCVTERERPDEEISEQSEVCCGSTEGIV